MSWSCSAMSGALAVGLWLCAALLWQPASVAAEGDQAKLVHTVETGEAVWTIARAYGVSMDAVEKANRGVDLARVRPGDELTIVGATREPARARRTIRSGRARRSRKQDIELARHLGLGSEKAAAQLLHGRAQAGWIDAAGGERLLEGNLQWPVAKGWFVRGFGSGAGGYHQAVDIGGEVGWQVRAAAGGIVAYAGHGVKGFGNLVILVHRGGWITLYGHNRENLVHPGQRIRRGQVIAKLGSTGLSKGPHVHFELLFDGENCNPAALFRPGVREKDGGLRNIRRRYWRKPGRKPRAIECHPRKHHPKHRT